MITIKDINKALVEKVTNFLRGTEYKNVMFSSTDITEEIIRPSFYFGIGTENKIGLATNKLKERFLEINLYYFSKDREASKLDLLTMQSYLEEILLTDLLVNESFYFEIENIDFDIRTKEGYLVATINLDSLEEIEIINNAEIVENLYLNI